MTTINIAFIGECMVELQRIEGEIKQSYGGDTLNTALYLSRLTEGKSVNVHYATAVGVDPLSKSLLTAWTSEGIKTDHVLKLEDKCPGIYYIETDATGERTFYYWRNDAAARYLFSQPQSAELINELMTFDAIYLSGISLAILETRDRETLIEFLTAYKAKGGMVIFDNNYRPKLWTSQEDALHWYGRILELTDKALLTFDDELDIYGPHTLEECISRTAAANVAEIVIKRGAEQCIVVTNGQQIEVPAVKVDNVVDTSAAGDSFSAGFLASRLLQGSPAEAAAKGHVMASTVIQYKGAVIPKDVMPKN